MFIKLQLNEKHSDSTYWLKFFNKLDFRYTSNPNLYHSIQTTNDVTNITQVSLLLNTDVCSTIHQIFAEMKPLKFCTTKN